MAVRREDVAASIRDRIMSGEYKADTKLPSYRALTNEFGGSRDTVGGAIRLLAEEGLVTVRGDKRVAVVSPSGKAAPTPEARLADARSELLTLRDDVLDVQQRLNDMTRRVTDALDRLRP
jgi:DNA-binding GntR family transcriptional regulator